MIGADMLRFSDRKIVLFDFETQRLNLLHDNLPWQAAWCVTQRGKVLSRHSYYLKWPGFVMSPDAARITRFNPEWVRNGDDPEFVLDAWQSFADDETCLLAGHNVLVGFDTPGPWRQWREELGRPADWSPMYRMLDSHLLARAYKEGLKPDRENLLAWQWKVSGAHRKGVKTSLGVMAKEFEIPVDPDRQHDATYDLELNAAVLWKLINLLEI